MAGAIVGDVSDATFQAEVLDASHEVPVVVDFWASWCGPCETLSPLLERIAGEYEGRVRVLKLNVDEQPETAARYGVTSIPMVVGFKNGNVAADFMGAQPEPEVRALFTQLVPSASDGLLTEAQTALLRGDHETARARFEAVLAGDPENIDAALGLAAQAMAAGDFETVERLLAPHEGAPAAKRMTAYVTLAQIAVAADRVTLEARLAADPDDAAAHYEVGCALAVAGAWEEGLNHLLRAVDLDRTLHDDGARLRMIDVFAQLGDQHELTRDFQRRLAMVIF